MDGGVAQYLSRALGFGMMACWGVLVVRGS